MTNTALLPFAVAFAVTFSQLARIIAGEAPGCSADAKLAVAWVWHNRQQAGIEGGWFGDRDPGPGDLALARNYQAFDDPTRGALFLIGPGDRARMPWLARYTRTGHWQCPGTWLESYAP